MERDSAPSRAMLIFGAQLPGLLTARSEEHTSELQSRLHLVCRLLLEKKKTAPSHRGDGRARARGGATRRRRRERPPGAREWSVYASGGRALQLGASYSSISVSRDCE